MKQEENIIRLNAEFWLGKVVLSEALIWVMFTSGILLASFTSSWTLAMVMGSLSLTVFYIAKIFFPNKSSYAASLCLGLLSTQLSFQVGSSFQITSVFFVCLAALIFNLNWKVFLPISIVFTIQQFLFYTWITNKTSTTGIAELGGNTLFFMMEVVICALISYTLNKVKISKEVIEGKYNIQCKNLDNNLAYAKEIASGNFDVKIESSKDDILGKSLMEMSNNLKLSAEQDKNRNWTVTGISRIAEIIRVANHNMDTLSNNLISFLVKYLNATQGGVFVFNENEKGNKYLELKGCYAYERKKYLEKRVELGQGLLGQAVLENDMIYLTEIPQDYFQITSGLGESNPRSLIIVPLKTDEEVVGALEIASFNKIDDYQRDFLEKVSESIASSIIFSKNNNRTNKLLNESQVLAEQLKSQEEEMRQNMEELQATQEDIQRKNLEMEKAEKDLLSSQAYLNSVINAIPNPIFVKDDKYRFVIVNDAFCRIAKMSKETLMFKTDFELFNADLAKVFYEKDKEVFDSASIIVNEESMVGENGQLKAIVTTKAPFQNSAGQKFIVGTIMDISEMKQLQNKLSREQYLLEALMNSTTDNIYFKDRESKFIRVSTNMASIFGAMSPEELIGKSDFDFFTKAHAQPAFDAEQEIIRTETPLIDIVEKETWEDGRETFVSTSKMPLKDLNHRIVGTFGISRDITNSKQTEAELTRNEKVYSIILENSSEVSTIVEENGAIKYQSPSYFKIFKQDVESIKDKTIFDLIHPDDVKDLKETFVKKSSTSLLASQNSFRYRMGNKWINMEVSVFNFLEQKDIKGFVINARRSS